MKVHEKFEYYAETFMADPKKDYELPDGSPMYKAARSHMKRYRKMESALKMIGVWAGQIGQTHDILTVNQYGLLIEEEARDALK